MDKKALQTYATWSKQYLEQQIGLSLKSLGIHGDEDIREAKRVGDVTVIDGDPTSYPAELKSQRDAIIRLIKTTSYNNTVETFAYTWFNRIIALRFMEVHGFLPHGFRVLSDSAGGIEPEILKNLSFVKNDLKLDMDVCASLKEKNDIDALFRYVLFKQCNALSEILPMLFDSEDSYLELLLPKSLLKGDTIISRLIELPEEIFLDDIEVIGWLYQFYISTKKDKVFADLKKSIKVTAENIPAATQLFTPDWIVRYMVENSLGRIWLESYPKSSLRSSMKYHIDEAIQDPDTESTLFDGRYNNVSPENITILEPCCGSGHVLVYIFDLLYKMYEEKGYMPREIPTLILSKNIYGLEIDKRAAQLASFSLVMRARSINNRFFDKTYYVRPQVYELFDSKELINMDYEAQLNETSLEVEDKKAIVKLVDLYVDAKDTGSLIRPVGLDVDRLEQILNKLREEVLTTFNVMLLGNGIRLLSKLIAQTKVLINQYDVCITNPPYLGGRKLNGKLLSYLEEYYPVYKYDLYTAFIRRCRDYTKPNGYRAMITQQGWMFLPTYTRLREEEKEITLINLIQLGAGAFEEIGGEVVQTATFVSKNAAIESYTSCFIKLDEVDGDNKECCFFDKAYYFENKRNVFDSIQDSPISYWGSSKTYELFKENKTLEHFVTTKQGLKSSDDNRFFRYWPEVDYTKMAQGVKSLDEAGMSNKKWFPLNKGGHKKWYGDNWHLINWENNGQEIKAYAQELYKTATRTITSIDYYFRESISWPKITSSPLFRIVPTGYVFSDAGSSMFYEENIREYLLGFLNTKIVTPLTRMINPTVNLGVGDMLKIPFIYSESHVDEIKTLVIDLINQSTEDWNSFETSWDFEEHPLVKWSHGLWDVTAIGANMMFYYGNQPKVKSPLELCYMLWQGECNKRFNDIKHNEEKLNQIFIDIYGLQDELTPNVDDSDITVRKADLSRDIKSFISYLVGIVMGRYSLDVPGLAFAGGDWDSTKYKSYKPDDDGIVPIYVGVGMEDGLTARVAELVKIIFGEETFRENIDTIADALGKANNESSLETLNRYLNDGFYADHLKIYQKRPIYWLFSSGKQKGFKCLVYMHRYNRDTLARVNARYYLPESTRQKIALDELEEQIKLADGKDKIRLEKSRQKLFDKYNETIEYGQVLDHLANMYIDINLDDGVKVNYAKFQGIELVSDSGVKIKKDLLVPLK